VSRYSALPQDRGEHPPIRKPHPDIARTQAKGTHHIDGKRDHLGIGERTRFTDQIAVELEVLSKPPPLLPLIAEQLGDREPADGFFQLTGAGRHHAGKRRGHLRPQCNVPVPFVLEIIQLSDDLLATLDRV
jgi:hypothetical protein